VALLREDVKEAQEIKDLKERNRTRPCVLMRCAVCLKSESFRPEIWDGPCLKT